MNVGDLRWLIRPLTDECELVLFDGEGGSIDVERADIQLTADGEGQLVLFPAAPTCPPEHVLWRGPDGCQICGDAAPTKEPSDG